MAEAGAPFAALLRAYRGATGLTQEELAERSGLSVHVISQLERGVRRAPRASTIEFLARALKLNPGQQQLFFTTAREAGSGRRSGGTDAVSALAADSAPRPRQLPLDVQGFSGRHHDLRRLDALMARTDEATAVVVSGISGMAGVGKTALAVHWAHRSAGRFPDGQLFVDLRGYSPDEPIGAIQALSLLLRGMGVDGDKVPIDIDAAAALYRSLLAGRRILVALDNARDAAQVRPLLPGTAGSMVVLTSRDRLSGLVASHGAHLLNVDVLEQEEALALLGEILGERRVRSEPATAAELASLCGHLPLALRIAAANLADKPDLSLDAYVAMLRPRGRLRRLEVAGDAQVAVAAAFDCSYHALMAPVQRLFRLLATVPGPSVGERAAAALLDATPPQTAPLLTRLVAVHLLERRRDERYSFHDLVRQYGQERAHAEESGSERLTAIERLSRWYLRTADCAARLLYPHVARLPVPEDGSESPPLSFEDRVGALAWLDAERANLVALVSGAGERGLWQMSWLLADTMRGYLVLRRHLVDWMAVADSGLDAATRGRDLPGQAAAQLSLGMANATAERHEGAVEHYMLALSLSRQAAWHEGRAAVLGGLGITHWQMGNLPQARSHLSRAAAVYHRIGLERGLAVTLVNLGNLNGDVGRLELARDQLFRALALNRRLGARLGEANALYGLGEVLHKLGRPDRALEYLAGAVPMYRELGYRTGETRAMVATARVQRDTGRYLQAVDSANAVLALSRVIGDRRGEEEALTVLGGVDLRFSRVQRAVERHEQGLAVARQAGALQSEASSLLGLAAAHLRQGRPDRATEDSEQALSIARRTGYRLLEADAHLQLSAIYLGRRRHAEAIQHARRALVLHREAAYRLGLARALAACGDALAVSGDMDAARAAWHEALTLFDDVGAAPESDEVRARLRSPTGLPRGRTRGRDRAIDR